jgi:hypothetical protein
LLDEAKVQLPPTAGPTAVEAKRELVEVVIEMFVGRSAMVGAEQPPLEQGDDLVDVRHELGRRLGLAVEKGDTTLIAVPA